MQENKQLIKKTVLYTISIVIFIELMITFIVGITVLVIKNKNQTETIEITENKKFSKNVIMIIPDGFGISSQVLAREYEGVDFLPLDQIQKGNSHTKSASNLITDSAAGGTALSCGIKTDNGEIAMDPQGKPCLTLLEAAMIHSMATGIVVKSRLTHATPASFSAHQLSRSQELDIAVQQLNSDFGNIDVLFGGGRDMFIPVSMGGQRTDGRNLETEAEEKGYTVIHTSSELNNSNLSTPVLGLFQMEAYPYIIDRQNFTDPPTLESTSNRALQLLSQKAQQQDVYGFFLMIECSLIDFCAHQNDPACQVRETVQCNEVVKNMKNFIDSNQDDSLLVIVADHETGGLSLGSTVVLDGKNVSDYVYYPELLKSVNKSSYLMTELVYNNQSTFEEVLLNYANISNLTQSELDNLNWAVDSLSFDNLNHALSRVISQRAYLGWTTYAHTGVDVMIYAHGSHSEDFVGSMDNTDVAKNIANFLQFDLVKDRVFVENSEMSYYSTDSPKINDSFHP
ncbi:alkaline phosphatase-related [Anaeramoeba ignava]|uniref:Alkaline phosphatase n=1 Tax=Anaeramoeba ignava TaxID=1746090 RepID=A0A9Q0R5L0_ANAIG|nr:alkaline phosphatase-related [Anaeramoeba ignava]|eukprot:Anaeramoba_ignava/a218729_22.p1 GENE.a218729_22~~a218729_22.p1  ORF type:complete len:511 (+),score=119.84 a218729_22:13-1545(+)